MRDFIFDLETTGLLRPEVANLSKQPRIIQIQVKILENLIEDEEFLSFINPQERLTKEIIKKTGIRDNMLKDAKLWEDVADDIKDMIESCDRVIAHNVMFDTQVIDYEMKRIKDKVKWPKKICTVEHTECLFGKRVKLSDLFTFCTKKPIPKGIHRADVDVGMLHEIYLDLFERGIIQ